MMTTTERARCPDEHEARRRARLHRTIERHFDEETGAPYWLERARTLPFDPRETIQDVADLARFGPFEHEALRTRSIFDFVPRDVLGERSALIVGDTSGTTGPPKRTLFTQAEFAEAFVHSFRPVTEPLGFPIGGTWLFAGPTGPHPIGRAACAVARSMDAPEPFLVDFDPRWARRFAEGSFPRKRYLAHLTEQVLWILEREVIDVLFSTPPLLLELGALLGVEKRAAIRGIHFGGMQLTNETRARIQTAFENAVLVSGYGNSLFGVSLEVEPGGDHVDYYPWSERLVIRVVPESGELEHDVEPFGRGRVVMSRLDDSLFLPNVVERDVAWRVPPSERARSLGIHGDGLRDPQPPRSVQAPNTGFY
ncbi:MAG: hypothetical protein H6834_08225 [Planctomycetes bacterium]|nr:hypothetical protein [Planctomycetota bacterium]